MQKIQVTLISIMMLALFYTSFHSLSYASIDELDYAIILLKKPLVSYNLPLQIKNAEIRNYDLSSMANLRWSVSNISADELQRIKVSLFRINRRGEIVGKETWQLTLSLPSNSTKEMIVELSGPIKRMESAMMVIEGAETSEGRWKVDDRIWPRITKALLHKKPFDLPIAQYETKTR